MFNAILDGTFLSLEEKKKSWKDRKRHALAEVVVCAVGRVVVLPLMEVTAQSTALPELATHSGGNQTSAEDGDSRWSYQNPSMRYERSTASLIGLI